MGLALRRNWTVRELRDIVADSSPLTTVQRVHPGGFFWNLQRGDRLANVVNLVARTSRLIVVASSARDAEEYSERLTLSGVPVVQAVDVATETPLRTYLSSDPATLVATHEYAVAHGPIPSAIAIHLRAALSVRDYAKRLEALPAAVHLTFVVPEDGKRARSLLSHFEHDHGHGGPADVDVDEVIDLTDSDALAMVSHARRRFPLGR